MIVFIIDFHKTIHLTIPFQVVPTYYSGTGI